jgi:organic radical activating enzyme
MITQVCNLSCLGCTNYSDLKHSGYVSWEQGHNWLSGWLTRIDIPDFGIMGGEPLINPECQDWLKGVRKLMPQSQIRFTTNGLLLDRHLDLLDLMYELGNVSFKITVHNNDSKLEELIQYIHNRFNWHPVNEFGIDRWISDNNFRFHVKRPSVFIKTYRNNYATMLPWNSNPVEAFANCCQQTCPLLYQGKIYKCSTSGLLEDTIAKVAPNFKSYWDPYIVSGLNVDCSDAELSRFTDNFGHPHSQCGQCPAGNSGSNVEHYKFVKLK